MFYILVLYIFPVLMFCICLTFQMKTFQIHLGKNGDIEQLFLSFLRKYY